MNIEEIKKEDFELYMLYFFWLMMLIWLPIKICVFIPLLGYFGVVEAQLCSSLFTLLVASCLLQYEIKNPFYFREIERLRGEEI